MKLPVLANTIKAFIKLFRFKSFDTSSEIGRSHERYIKRKIRPLVLTGDEFSDFMSILEDRPHFLVWKRR